MENRFIIVNRNSVFKYLYYNRKDEKEIISIHLLELLRVFTL